MLSKIFCQPNKSNLTIFILLAFLLFSDLILNQIGFDIVTKNIFFIPGVIIVGLKYFLFFPVTLINGAELLLTLFITGDYTYIPSFWNVISHGIGFVYAYYLSCALSNLSTRIRFLKFIIMIVAIYSFVMGSLFLIWQYNPSLADGVNFQNNYFYGAVGILLYILGIYLVYYWIKKIKMDKGS